MGAPRGRAARAVAEPKSKGSDIPTASVQETENDVPVKTPGKENAPRAALSNITNTPFKTPLKAINQKVDCSAKINALLEELEVEINGQCKEMQHYAQGLGNEMTSQMKVKLMSIPKKVRGMTLSEFIAAHIDQANITTTAGIEDATPASRPCKSERAASSRGTRSAVKRTAVDSEMPETGGRTTRTRTMLAQTPAAQMMSSAQTPMRTPFLKDSLSMAETPSCYSSRKGRRGEVIFSARGSPLGAWSDVPPPTPAASISEDNKSLINVQLEDQHEVNIGDKSDLVQLSGRARLVVKDRLKTLQDQLTDYMEAITETTDET